MPIYEYECRRCGHQFEQLVLPKSAPPACPACQSQGLERMLSMFAVNSETTRKLALDAGRRQAAKIRRDKAHAEHEEFHHHHH